MYVLENHELYNFVKPKSSFDRSVNNGPSKVNELKYKKENNFQVKLAKNLDRLQEKYGVPPSFRPNPAEDLIVSEFASIWENVFSFRSNVLKIDDNEKISNKSYHNPILSTKVKAEKPDDGSKMKVSLKSKLKHKPLVILESRPYKFKSQNQKCKSRKLKQPDRYEPMSDAELAKALNLDVEEVKEYFEYANENASETVCLDAFGKDDAYNLDVDGLKLGEISTLPGNENISKSLEDLMAAHGYDVDGNVIDPACYDGDEDTASSTRSMGADADLDRSIHEDITTSLEDLMAEHGYDVDGNVIDRASIDGDVDLGTVSGGNNDQESAEDDTETSLEDDRSDVCRCSTEESEFSDVDDSEASGMCQCTTSEGSKSDGESIDSDEETSDSTSSSFTEESFSSSS